MFYLNTKEGSSVIHTAFRTRSKYGSDQVKKEEGSEVVFQGLEVPARGSGQFPRYLSPEADRQLMCINLASNRLTTES